TQRGRAGGSDIIDEGLTRHGLDLEVDHVVAVHADEHRARAGIHAPAQVGVDARQPDLTVVAVASDHPAAVDTAVLTGTDAGGPEHARTGASLCERGLGSCPDGRIVEIFGARRPAGYTFGRRV